jgi:hypothetical protein
MALLPGRYIIVTATVDPAIGEVGSSIKPQAFTMSAS